MSLVAVNWHPADTQLRTFGIICTTASLALGGWVWWRHGIAGMDLSPAAVKPVIYSLWTVAAASAVLAWTAPRALRPLYVVLTAVSLPMGFAISYLTAAALFYGVLTPYGLVFRLLKRDPLERKFEQGRTSYWSERRPVTTTERYYRQY